MSDWFYRSDYAASPINLWAMLLGILLSFLGGQILAWVYMLTRSGLSYSKSFVSSLVVIPMIVSVVMQVLNNNLVTAFGLMAIFAIVRFRNILRDTLDTTYVLAVIVIGMACGTQRFGVAVVGCLVTAFALLYLWYTAFGSRHRYDIIVNLHWTKSLSDLMSLNRLLERHSRRVHCASQRPSEEDAGADLSYRLLLRNARRTDDLVGELRALEGVSRLTTFNAEQESEL
jgi:hypothetical protein